MRKGGVKRPDVFGIGVSNEHKPLLSNWVLCETTVPVQSSSLQSTHHGREACTGWNYTWSILVTPINAANKRSTVTLQFVRALGAHEYQNLKAWRVGTSAGATNVNEVESWTAPLLCRTILRVNQ
jgi:hypothetical protein